MIFKNAPHSFIKEIQQFGISPLEEPIAHLSSQLQNTIPQTRIDLVAKIKKLIRQKRIARDEDFRISVVKVLVACLPESKQLICRVIDNPNDPVLKEVHFTLFCYLDEIESTNAPNDFHCLISSLLHEYLLSVRTSSAHAAWMCADLLGDHWDLDEGISILQKVLLNGRFVAGREASLHGLKMAWGRISPKGSAKKTSLINVLRQSAKADRSQHMRNYVRCLAKELRGSLRGNEGERF